MMKKSILICLLFFTGLLAAKEYTVKTVPNPKTYDNTTYVSNPDGILKSQTVSRLNNTLNSLEKDTKAEVAVVVLNSIGSEDIKDFAINLFQEWGIGKAGADNGLLILFVEDQRAITFETGYGLEGILPDAIAKRIQNQQMLPEFRNGDYDAGFIAGVDRVASIIREEPVPVTEQKESAKDYGYVLYWALFIYIAVAVISWLWMSRSAQRIKTDPKYQGNAARYTALKNQKSGINSIFVFILPIILLIIVIFFINPGLLLYVIPIPFMVIPANIYGSRQLKKIRQQPIPCDECGGTMKLLTEKEEDPYLNLSQKFEEQIGSVDYDVFKCNNCDNIKIFTYDKSSPYSKCPKCGTKAFAKASTRTIVAPTYSSTGVERTTYKCKFCGYEEHKDRKIPRLERPSTTFVKGAAAGSIIRGSGGGFGGGGRSSGGSFGGGRSGGGGATSRW